MSQCYLGGPGRLVSSEAIGRFAVAAALSTRPADRVLSLMLEDDRLVLRCDMYFSSMREELEALWAVPRSTLDLLKAVSLADCAQTELRSDVLQAAEVAVAYTDRKLFGPVMGASMELGYCPGHRGGYP